MPVNLDKPHLWKADVAKSVDMYNDWFMRFAPSAFRLTRVQTTKDVETSLRLTGNLINIQPSVIREHPEILPTLRMSTCPPLAVDRLIGLSGVPSYLVKNIEDARAIPKRMDKVDVERELAKIGDIIRRMADPDIFTWLDTKESPAQSDIYRAATIVADRLCGAVANPIIRNAQEKRQLAAIKAWLEANGYKQDETTESVHFDEMSPGSFSFRTNVPVKLDGSAKNINIPIDVVIMPKTAQKGSFPIFIEAKSAGDFTNTNKRRKEEATKMKQLLSTYGKKVQFVLFLCGYFDSGYLGYEAAEGIDWIWEHRIEDLATLGI